MNDNSMKMKVDIYIRMSTEEQTKEDYLIEFQLNSNISS